MLQQFASDDNDYAPEIEENHRVIFKKPLLPELTASYTVIDLHFHSRYSDGFNTIDAIAARARKLNVGIAVTDHNAIGGAVEISKYKDILSIPGIEITSVEGAHILLYFYTVKDLVDFYQTELSSHLGKNVMTSCDMTMEYIIFCARKYDAVVVFPHPYCAVYTGVCNPIFSKERQALLLSMADGIEVINGGNIHKWNLKSALLGFNMNTGLYAGSDGHNLFQMGSAVTYAACKNEAGAFLDAMREKRTWAIGKEIGLLRKVTANSLKIRTNFSNSSDLFGKNIRYSAALINSGSRMVRNRVNDSLENRRNRKARQKVNIV